MNAQATPRPTNYLEQFDAAAPADQYPLVRHWIDTEPLTFFKELREKRPILVTPLCTLITLFDDVTEVLNMPRIFTAALYLPKMENGIYLMAHDDDALHTREKSLMQGMLNRDDLPQVRTMVAKIAKDLLDAANGHMDAINGYCRMVPATLVQEYFGLTGIDRKDLIEWSYCNQADTFYNQPFDLISDQQRKDISDRHNQAGEQLSKYITKLILERLAVVKAEQGEHLLLAPWYLMRAVIRKLMGKTDNRLTDDVVTRMVRTTYPGAVDFDIKRLGINAGGLLIGAIETTSQAVAQVIEFLLEIRMAGQGKERCGERRSYGIRWHCLGSAPLRSDFTFSVSPGCERLHRGKGHQSRHNDQGRHLHSSSYAVGDVRQKAFENPDEFIPGRNWYHYFHFGFGSHECLGKYVGMVMIPEMVRQILLRPDLKANGGIDFKAATCRSVTTSAGVERNSRMPATCAG